MEKARWGRFNIIKGKTKVEMPKTTKVEKMTLEEAKAIIEKKATKKKNDQKENDQKNHQKEVINGDRFSCSPESGPA